MEGQKSNITGEKNFSTMDMETLINKLNGVISSKAVTGDNNEITEMHILSDYSRSPKQIVRDIQSAVAAVYAIHIDHRIISVAQIDNGLITSNDIRLKINNVQVFAEGLKLNVKVILSYRGNNYEGTASGMNSSSGRPNTVIHATLASVHSFLNENNIYSLYGVKKLDINNMEVYIVSVGYLNGHESELLVGSSLIKHDEYHAIIRSTLDAINRSLRRALGGKFFS